MFSFCERGRHDGHRGDGIFYIQQNGGHGSVNTFPLQCKCVHLSIKKNRTKFLRLRIKHFSFKNAKLNMLRFLRTLKTLKELL